VIRNYMKKILKFLGEVRQELLKVTWLSRKEAMTSTLMVVVTVAVFSLIFVVADFLIYHIINFFMNLGV